MTSTSALLDAHGNPVTGGRHAVDRYDSALDRWLRFHPAVVDEVASLAEDQPGFAMGQAMAAYLCLTSTDVPDLEGATAYAAALAAAPTLGEREAGHRAAVEAWLAGDWHGAARQLDEVLVRWPSDLLALLVGHQLDFFVGDAANLRDRVGRTLRRFDPAHPHQGFVSGMYAFGLEESGNYALAEEHGLAAVEAHPDDVWAIHAVVHVLEMQGRVDEGIRFLVEREKDWGTGNLFTVHNWWHLALYLLEAGRPETALALYDAQVHHAGSDGVPLEMLDASALLWRLLLDGTDTGGRFAPLADAWASRTKAEPWYAFNDLHAVMALAGAGRFDDAGEVVRRLERYVDEATSRGATSAAARSNVAMTAQVGLPGCRAVLAYAAGRDREVLDQLLPVRSTFARFGGSHAQRDALQRTVLAAALRSGRFDLAQALLSERLAQRETSVFALERWAATLVGRGDVAGAASAVAAADANRTRFAAAAEGWAP